MKATLDLHDLVHSLTQTEKRYVQVFGARHLVGEESKYLELFKALQEQKKYDEDKIKEKFLYKFRQKALPLPSYTCISLF